MLLFSMKIDARTEELIDHYRYHGFYPKRQVMVSPKDAGARIIGLSRRSKKQSVAYAKLGIRGGMTGAFATFVILDVQRPEFFLQ